MINDIRLDISWTTVLAAIWVVLGSVVAAVAVMQESWLLMASAAIYVVAGAVFTAIGWRD